MSWRLALSAMGLAICLGCGVGNRLPRDLAGHLAENGIALKVTRSHSPLNSRGGYVIAKHEAPVEGKIVTAFKLAPVAANDPAWQRIAARWKLAANSASIFGITGRPATLKLKNGSQLEYLYLVVMGDGTMWLVAEYAYG